MGNKVHFLVVKNHSHMDAWDIMTEEEIRSRAKYGNVWVKFTGDASLIPAHVRNMIERFEQVHGHRIERPYPLNHPGKSR